MLPWSQAWLIFDPYHLPLRKIIGLPPIYRSRKLRQREANDLLKVTQPRV